MRAQIIRTTNAFPAAQTREFRSGRPVEIVAGGSRFLMAEDVDGTFFVEEDSLTMVDSPSSATSPASRSGIQEFKSANFVGDPVLAEISFIPLLQLLDDMAKAGNLQVHVTSSWRKKDAAISGAIVTPASRSNHFVGHAIDMNIVFQGSMFTSQRLQRQNFGTLPTPIADFLSSIRKHPVLRWGGDFVKADPVHIDDDLSRRDPQKWDQMFATIFG